MLPEAPQDHTWHHPCGHFLEMPSWALITSSAVYPFARDVHAANRAAMPQPYGRRLVGASLDLVDLGAAAVPPSPCSRHERPIPGVARVAAETSCVVAARKRNTDTNA